MTIAYIHNVLTGFERNAVVKFMAFPSEVNHSYQVDTFAFYNARERSVPLLTV